MNVNLQYTIALTGAPGAEVPVDFTGRYGGNATDYPNPTDDGVLAMATMSMGFGDTPGDPFQAFLSATTLRTRVGGVNYAQLDAASDGRLTGAINSNFFGLELAVDPTHPTASSRIDTRESFLGGRVGGTYRVQLDATGRAALVVQLSAEVIGERHVAASGEFTSSFSIQPQYLAAHPQTTIEFSPGILNAPIPEPATSLLFGLGAAGLVAGKRFRRGASLSRALKVAPQQLNGAERGLGKRLNSSGR